MEALIAWSAALLNFMSGVLLVIPALRMTRDLRLIRNAEADKEAQSRRASRLPKVAVDLIVENAGVLQEKMQQWDLRDTVLLYAGLSAFVTASFLDLLSLALF